MKKLVCITMIFCLIPLIAFADVDLSAMSYSELIDLNHTLTAEIMSRPEWKEVEVPAGQWRVGSDIPAGEYAIKIKDKERVSPVKVQVWESQVDDSMLGLGALYKEYINADTSINRIELKEGWILDVNYTVIFTPPVMLGF